MKYSYLAVKISLCIVLWAAAAAILPAQTFIKLVDFTGPNGWEPFGALIQGPDGNLYGTTAGGGANCTTDYGCGTIFKMSPTGTVTVLYSFCPVTGCSDGDSPRAGLILADDGNFYGTTVGGGNGPGTVFKVTPGGTLTTLYRFSNSDGAGPSAPLIQGPDGTFYGTTAFGGDLSDCGGSGCGTVFKMTPSGSLTTLHQFNGTDGEFVAAGLAQAPDGSLYGTTEVGGANNLCPTPWGTGCGTAFKLTTSGTFISLYSFCSLSSCADGALPLGGLIHLPDGHFYGTTSVGGTATGCNSVYMPTCGTVFQLLPGGALTTVSNLTKSMGGVPFTGLALGNEGGLYGTTTDGGIDDGTIIRIAPGGGITVLASFNGTNGAQSNGTIFQATSGIFYGTTQLGGSASQGTAYSLNGGLPPFILTNRTAGPVGAYVEILGNGLTGATGVTFNGSAATTFTVESATLIVAQVPAGATTGLVRVQLSSGTLSTVVPFVVVP
jgi:uncharacterized repeat protein (TIGR03803 family)